VRAAVAAALLAAAFLLTTLWTSRPVDPEPLPDGAEGWYAGAAQSLRLRPRAQGIVADFYDDDGRLLLEGVYARGRLCFTTPENGGRNVRWGEAELVRHAGTFALRLRKVGSRALSGLIQRRTDALPCQLPFAMRAECVHPELDSGPDELREAVRAARDEAQDRCRAECLSLLEDLEYDDFASRYRYSEEWAIAGAGATWISLKGEVSSYAGGAHGNSWFRTRTFWVREGTAREARLQDLFKPCSPWLETLSARVLSDLARQEADHVVDEMITTFAENDLADWCLTGRSLEFSFAPYHVGPYGSGSYLVSLPVDELAELLSPDGPLGDRTR
jgi:hypothetical protein